MPAKSENWIWIGIPLCAGILLGGVWQEIFGLTGAVIFPAVAGSALLCRRMGCSLGTGVALALGLLLVLWVAIGFIVALMGIRPGAVTGMICGIVGDAAVALMWRVWWHNQAAVDLPSGDALREAPGR